MPRQSLDRQAVTVVNSWRQLSLFTQWEMKQLSLSRRQQIERRLKKERQRESDSGEDAMDQSIPALSLRQPWAWAVLHAGKSVENRMWATKYRGRIRIHAARRWDPHGEEWIAQHLGRIVPNPVICRDKGWLGAYLGEVTVTNCVAYDAAFRAVENPWAFGPICWILTDARAYPEPIPGRGYPGLYFPERNAAVAENR